MKSGATAGTQVPSGVIARATRVPPVPQPCKCAQHLQSKNEDVLTSVGALPLAVATLCTQATLHALWELVAKIRPVQLVDRALKMPPHAVGGEGPGRAGCAVNLI